MKRHQHILLWLVTLALCSGIAVGNNLLVPPDWAVTLVDSAGTSVISGGAVKVTGGGGGGSSQVEGRAADGAAAVGNPVLVGLTDNTNAVSLRSVSAVDNIATATSGPRILAVTNLLQGPSSYVAEAAAQAVADASSAARNAAVSTWIYNNTTWDRLRTANAASGTTGTGLLAAGMLIKDSTNWVNQVTTRQVADGDTGADTVSVSRTAYNDATWDQVRNNTDATVLTSLSRTITSNTTFTNFNSTYLRVVIDVTVAGTGSITPSIEAQDAVSGQWITLLTGTAITTVSTTALRVGPGLTAVANLTANDFLSRNMRVTITHNNANAITYSVGRQLTGN